MRLTTLSSPLQMFMKEQCEFAPSVKSRQAVVGRTLVAEKPVLGIRIDFQCIRFAKFFESGLDLSNSIKRNEWIGTTEEQVYGHRDVFYCLDPLI